MYKCMRKSKVTFVNIRIIFKCFKYHLCLSFIIYSTTYSIMHEKYMKFKLMHIIFTYKIYYKKINCIIGAFKKSQKLKLFFKFCIIIVTFTRIFWLQHFFHVIQYLNFTL